MKNEICFRPFQRADRGALEEIIRDTWEYDKFCSPKTAKRMARLYLASCLANQTFTCVAVRGGVPVGVIMGKKEKGGHAPLHCALQMLASTLPLLCSREGRKIFKLFAGFEALDKELLAQSGQQFDGELAFFAVRGGERGTGIGKALFTRLLDYLQAQGVKSFYLYTDSTCNFGFYEHQGMRRIGEKRYSFQPHSDEEIRFYLYCFDGEVSGGEAEGARGVMVC